MAPSSRGRPPAAIWLLPAVLALFGAAVLTVSVLQLRKAAVMAAWPHVEGRIIRSRVAGGATSKDARGKKSSSYVPDIAYEFQVSGRSYTSTSVWVGGSYGTSAGIAASIAERYPVGSTVTVHYLPGDPSESYIETSPGFALWLQLGAGLALLGLAAASGAGIRRLRKRPTA